MFHRIFGVIAVAGAFSTSAWSADLNIKEGEWEFIMKADILGTIIDESDRECTTPEDRTKTTSEFVKAMLTETNCSIGTSSYTVNLFEGTAICSSSSPFSDGEFTLQYSPSVLAMIIELRGRGEFANLPVKMSILSHHRGACPTR